MPLVSLIIPVFNRCDLLRECLASLYPTLEGAGHEIILVDDGSTDGAREYLRALLPPHRVLLNEGNLGFAASNNRAAREAKGEFLVLANSDLLFEPGWLAPLLEPFRLRKKVGFVGNVQVNARTAAIDHAGVAFTLQGKPEHDTKLPRRVRLRDRHKRVPAVTAACAAIRRETFLELGGFDEEFVNGGEDIDLCLRAAQAGHVHLVALDSVVRHHVSASPGRKLRDEQNSRRLMRKWREATFYWTSRTLTQRYFQDLRRSPWPSKWPALLPALLFHCRLTRRPPRFIAKRVEKALRLEEARWQEMFGDE